MSSGFLPFSWGWGEALTSLEKMYQQRLRVEEAEEKSGWAFWVTSVCKSSQARSEHTSSGRKGAPKPFERMLLGGLMGHRASYRRAPLQKSGSLQNEISFGPLSMARLGRLSNCTDLPPLKLTGLVDMSTDF